MIAFDIFGDVDRLVSVLRDLSVPFSLQLENGIDVLTVGRFEAQFCLEVAKQCKVHLEDRYSSNVSIH